MDWCLGVASREESGLRLSDDAKGALGERGPLVEDCDRPLALDQFVIFAQHIDNVRDLRQTFCSPREEVGSMALAREALVYPAPSGPGAAPLRVGA